jgi:hypothetical protein
MKNFFGLFLVVGLLAGCGGDEVDDAVKATQGNSASAKINGVAWSAASTDIAGASTLGMVSFAMTNSASGFVINLNMPSNITPGSYTMNYEEETYWGSVSDSRIGTGASIWFSVSGTLKITQHNTSANRIEGEFSFEATSVVDGSRRTVTEGKFAANYVE